MTEPAEPYGDWRSLELAIKDAAKKAAAQAGPGVSAASVSAQIKQARFDRFLSHAFADGEESELLLKGGMSMLARVPRSRTTKDVDLATLHSADLAEDERALSKLVAADLGDHLTFRLIRTAPTGLGDNQPGVATRRIVFACIGDLASHRRGGGGPGLGQHGSVGPIADTGTLNGVGSERRADLRQDRRKRCRAA